MPLFHEKKRLVKKKKKVLENERKKHLFDKKHEFAKTKAKLSQQINTYTKSMKSIKKFPTGPVDQVLKLNKSGEH